MKTEKPFVVCSNCNNDTNRYYFEPGFKDKICKDCLIKTNNGFPDGKGVFLPCHLCKEPNIFWYYKTTYGIIQKDCGGHFTDVDNMDLNNLFD